MAAANAGGGGLYSPADVVNSPFVLSAKHDAGDTGAGADENHGVVVMEVGGEGEKRHK
jgi:hypothetical protein